MAALPAEVRADVFLERAELTLPALDVRAGVPPAVAVHLHFGHDRPHAHQTGPTPAGARP
jgi:hypothetical protein